jgi:predicted Zn-dependent protease
MKLLPLLIFVFLSACTSVSITERKQLIILGDDVIYPQAFKAYDDFKKKNKLIEEGADFNKIQEITENIKKAIKVFYESHKKPDPTANFKWEVILVDNNDIKNAWCMPGGKMAVYSGILDIANNDNALAALMGHEIAHAVARHGSERASQGVLLDIGTMALEKLILGQSLSGDSRKLYEYFANFGVMLPFSRGHETEADYLGLVFMHIAGYEMEEAARMWQRMNKENSNSQPPEFLSTHPSNKTRIENIRKWIPEVKKKFKLS